MRKKLFTLLLAVAASVGNLYASKDVVPSDAVLADYYNQGDVCVCIFVPADMDCNDIVLTGSFNGWKNTAAECITFEPVEGYDGWYVCSFEPDAEPDAEKGIQAKPIMLDVDGNFNWDYQVGAATVIRGALQIVQGYFNEINLINYGTDAPNVFTIEGWKQNPCNAIYHNYTVTVINDGCNGLTIPFIVGGMTNWNFEQMQLDWDKTIEYQTAVYYYTFKAAEGTPYQIASGLMDPQTGLVDSTALPSWWDEAFMQKLVNGVWVRVPGDEGDNQLTHEETEIVFDLRSDTLQWARCYEPPIEQVTITLIPPTGAPAEGIECIGNFDEWTGTTMTNTNGVYTVTVFAKPTYRFKFRQVGTWDNQIEIYDQDDDDWVTLNDFVFGELWEGESGNRTITLDLSDPDIYKWSLEEPAPSPYLPYNLQAEPGAGTVTLTWEAQEVINGYYTVTLYHNGKKYSETEGITSATFVLNNDTTMTFTWTVYASRFIPPFTFIEVGPVEGEAFTVAPSPYVPKNLQAEPNGDGTYTITWDMESTEGVGECHVEMFYENGNYFDDRYVYSSNSCQTNMVTSAGEYYYRITVYDYNDNFIGYASSSFTVAPTEPRDITVRVLIQPNSNYDTTNGVLFASFDRETANFIPVMANNVGNSWYEYTYTITDPALRFRLSDPESSYGYYGERILTKDTCYELSVDNYFHQVNCDAVAHDYKPYSLQAVPGDGKATLSWSALDLANYYAVRLYDVNGNMIASRGTSDTTITIFVSTDSITMVSWSVCPNYITNATVYGEPFMVNPSPYIPQNLQAVPNGDGTYTITWDAVNKEEVNSYYVYLSGPSYYDYFGGYDTETSFVTPVLPFAGEYTYTVYAVDSTSNQDLGYASSTITVIPVESHDITVRVLVQPYAELDTTRIYFSESRAGSRIKPNYEGNGWYSYTFTTTNPGIYFYLNNSGYGSYTCGVINRDTCLMFNGRMLQGAECDAVPQTEFDITMNILDVQNPKLAPEWVIYNMSNERGTFRFVFNLPEGEKDVQLGKEYTLADRPQSTPYYDSNGYGYYRIDENSSSSYIYYDSVSLVKTIDADSILRINAVVISKNGITYRLHYTHDLHYLVNDKAEEDFMVEFADYRVEKIDEDTMTYLLIYAENYGEDYVNNSEGIRLGLIVPDEVSDLSTGTYPIDYSMNDYSVLACTSVNNTSVSNDFRGSLAYRQNFQEQAYWLMVSGTVTIDADKNINIDAINSYGRIIRCRLKNPEATSVELIQSIQSTPAQKVMINGQIYILRGDKIYTLTGAEVK